MMLHFGFILVVICSICSYNVLGQNTISATICEHAKSAYTMTCSSSQYIVIMEAMYGRQQRDVGGCAKVNPPSNGCKAVNSLTKARNHVTTTCGSKPSICTIRATNSIFGDPCVGKPKYLQFSFRCVARERTEFLNQPTIKDEHANTLTLGSTITLSGCNYADNINKPEDLQAVWLKENKNISSVGIEPLGDQQFTLGPLRINSATMTDEGDYRCGIMKNGILKATSSPIEILLEDVIRVKFTISVQALIPQFYQRKRRDSIPTDNIIMENIQLELDKIVSKNDGNVETRFVRNLNLLDIYISKKKTHWGHEATQLFDQFKFLLRMTSIAGNRVTVKNKDFCEAETIGSSTFKGQYTFPTSPTDVKITKKCVHGTMNVNVQGFERICLENGKWSTGDLDHCLAETKTTQELLNLEKNPICQTPKQKNCEQPVQKAQQLVSIVSSSQVITIPEEVSLVSNIINELANNINKVATQNETTTILTDAMDVTSLIVDVEPDVIKVADKTTNALQNVRQGLEKIAKHSVTLLPIGSEVKISKPNIGFVGAKVKRTDLTISAVDSGGSLISVVSADAGKPSPTAAKAVMNIPESVLDSNKKQVSLFSFTYRTDTLFGNNQNKTTGSHILSATFDDQKFENLLTPINITFKVSSNAVNVNPNCSFWDETKDIWSSKGLTTNSVEDDEKSILCQTTHLTNFALIIDVSQTRANPLALQVITWIGCGISLGGLILTVISYSAFRRLRRRLVPRLLLCLSISLIVTLLLFLMGVERSESETTCQVVAALIQYFLLVSFFWMAAQGINLYKKMVRVLKKHISDSQYFLRSFIVCTVCPAIIVVVSASSKSEYYGDDNFCLVHGLPFYIGLVLPICFIILLNIVLLILVLRAIHNTPSNVRASKSIDEETPYMLKLAKITIACSVLLGVTWLFGFLAVGELTEVMQYLFCIFNSLQGFFIFVFYTLTNEEVKKEWANLLGWETILSSFSQTTTKKSTLHLNARSKSHASTSSVNANNNILNISSDSSSTGEPRYANTEELQENEYCTIQDVKREAAPYRSQALSSNAPRDIKNPIYYK
eukprot:TCONS_00036725-protein